MYLFLKKGLKIFCVDKQRLLKERTKSLVWAGKAISLLRSAKIEAKLSAERLLRVGEWVMRLMDWVSALKIVSNIIHLWSDTKKSSMQRA